MPLNSSGPLSLGGSTTGQSINRELVHSDDAAISMISTENRILTGKATGALTLPTDWYGKSYEPVIGISVSTAATQNGSTVTINWNITLASSFSYYVTWTGTTPPASGTVVSSTALTPVSSGTVSFTAYNPDTNGSDVINTIYFSVTGINTRTYNSSSIITVHVESGKLLSTFCSGYNLTGNYANGSGGSYTGLVASNSATCGYTPPSVTVNDTSDYSSTPYYLDDGTGNYVLQGYGRPLVGRTAWNWSTSPGGFPSYTTANQGVTSTINSIQPAWSVYGGGYGTTATLTMNTFAFSHDNFVLRIDYTDTSAQVAYSRTDVNLNVQRYEHFITLVANVSVPANTTYRFQGYMRCEYNGDYDYSIGPNGIINYTGTLGNPSSGTLLSQYCSGFDLYGTYADGSGGTYDSRISTNSPSCGYGVVTYTETITGPSTVLNTNTFSISIAGGAPGYGFSYTTSPSAGTGSGTLDSFGNASITGLRLSTVGSYTYTFAFALTGSNKIFSITSSYNPPTISITNITPSSGTASQDTFTVTYSVNYASSIVSSFSPSAGGTGVSSISSSAGSHTVTFTAGSAAGSYTFTLTATGSDGVSTASASTNFTVVSPITNPVITGPTSLSISSGQNVQSWDNYQVVSGGVGPYTWTYYNTLPTGVTLSPLNGDTTRDYYTGTVTQTGTFTIPVYATDSTNRTSNTITTSITITPPPVTLTITGPNAFTFSASDTQFFTQKVYQVTNGTGPYTWSNSGTRPAGVYFSAPGAPSPTTYNLYQAFLGATAGTYNVTVSVTDTYGNSGSYAVTITVTANASSIALDYNSSTYWVAFTASEPDFGTNSYSGTAVAYWNGYPIASYSYSTILNGVPDLQGQATTGSDNALYVIGDYVGQYDVTAGGFTFEVVQITGNYGAVTGPVYDGGNYWNTNYSTNDLEPADELNLYYQGGQLAAATGRGLKYYDVGNAYFIRGLLVLQYGTIAAPSPGLIRYYRITRVAHS